MKKVFAILASCVVLYGGSAYAQTALNPHSPESVAQFLKSNSSSGSFLLPALTDDRGKSMDALEIAQESSASYVGLYHHHIGGDRFCTSVATSNNLLTRSWIFRTELDCNYASQPDIQRLPDGRYLIAYEKNGTNGSPSVLINRPFIRLMLFRDLQALLSNRSERTFDLPGTAGALADGTPNFRWVRYAGDPSAMTVELGFHANINGLDRNFIGIVDSFSSFRSWPQGDINAQVGAVAGGNIGDRSFFQVDGHPYSLLEGQKAFNDWGSWKLFLYDEIARRTLELGAIDTPCASQSMGNPNLSVVRINGFPYLVGTVFVFSERANCQAGSLLFGRRIREGLSSANFNIYDPVIRTLYPQNLYHGVGFNMGSYWGGTAGAAGHIVYGPYDSTLPNTQIRVDFDLMIEQNSLNGGTPVANIEIRDARTGESTLQIINKADFYRPGVFQKFSLNFDWRGHAGNPIETRVWTYGTAGLGARTIEILDLSFVKTLEPRDMPHGTGFAVRDGWRAEMGQVGHMVYGPYDTALPPRPLSVVFEIAAGPEFFTTAPTDVVFVDVFNPASGRSSGVAIPSTAFRTPLVPQRFTVPFDMTGQGGQPLETRVWTYGRGAVEVKKINIFAR